MGVRKFFLFIFLLSASFCAAQTSTIFPKTVEKEFIFKIHEVLKTKTDTVILLFKEGGTFGIKKGDQGKIYAIYNDKEPKRSQKELGYFTIAKIDGDTFGALASIYHPNDENGMVKAGDYVSIYIDVPPRKYNSILYQLSIININFLNLYGKPMYTTKQLISRDDRSVEDSVLNHCIKEIGIIYDMAKKKTSFDIFKTIIPTGRYAGRSAFDILEKASTTDLKGFLNYVKTYPATYIAYDKGLAESFAYWLLGNADLTDEEVLDSVRKYDKFPIKQKAFLTKNRTLIIQSEFLRSWTNNAYDLVEKGNDLSANEILALTEKAGTLLPDTSGMAFYYYILAQISLDKGQNLKSISYCNKAIDLFKQANNFEFYFSTKIKRFYLEGLTLNFDAVKKTQAELTTDFESYKAKLSFTLYHKFKGRYWAEYGNILKRQGNLNEAKETFKQAGIENTFLNNFLGAVKTASAQESIADIETIQNNYAGAISIYDSLIVAYEKLNQPIKKANVLNNKGYAYNKMGEFEKSIKISEEALKIQIENKEWDSGGYSLSFIGQNLWSLGKLAEAIKSHKLAIEYRKRGNNANGVGYSFDKLGKLYVETGDKGNALAVLDSAKFYYKKVGAVDKLAEVDGTIGKLYLAEKNNGKALTYFLSAYETLKTLGLKQEMAAQIYNAAGATYTDQPQESFKYYQQAFELYKAAGIKDEMLYCLLNMGNIETRNKNYPAAENYLKDALALSKEINGKVEQAITYKKLAEAAITKLNINEALLKYGLALALYKEIDDKTEISNINLSMSYVQIVNGKFDLAEAHIKQAFEIATAVNNDKLKADVYITYADLYQLRAQFPLAKEALDNCFKIYQKLGNSYQIANTYITAGNYFNHLSENVKAIANYKLADSIYIAEKQNDIRFTPLNNIGTVYFYQADYDQALVYFNQAAKILENQKIITEDKLLILSNIGEVYYHKKDYVTAEKYLLEAMKYCDELKVTRSKAITSLILGKLYYDKADYIKSSANLLFAYNYAKSTNENSQLVEAALYLGKLSIAQKKEAEASAYFNETIVNSDRVGDLRNVWEALYQRGLIFYDKNQLDSAEHYFKQAIVRVDKSVANLFGGAAAKKIFTGDEKKVSLYNTLISTLIKLGKTDEALEFTSKSNIEAIREKMQQVGIKTADVKKSAGLDQQKKLAQTVSSVQDNLNKEKAKPIDEQSKEKIISLQKVQKFAQAQLLNFVDSMVTAYPDLKDNFVKNVNPEELKKYKSKIPADVAVLLYVVRENQLIIFTLTAETTKAKLIDISGAELSAYVKDFNTILKYPFKDKNAKPLKLRGVELSNYVESAHSLAETGSYLYKILIDPIKEEIAGKTKLCIINNGELSSIPFQTIGNKDSKGTFRYLVEDYSIFYTNRLDIFSNVEPSLIKGLSFVAYGNPDKTLPSAEREVKEINKIITDATIYIGAVATEDKAKQSLVNSRIVHFATHGILDYNDFSKTFLKFAPSAGNDGKLTIQDIKGLDIENCDLVTLSACETAVSQDVSKGWFVSPANSLLVNGVKTVVASLWSVDDEATSLLMSSFYENLKTMHKAEALRKAQETLSHNPKYVHPFYWGAFILYGEWR